VHRLDVLTLGSSPRTEGVGPRDVPPESRSKVGTSIGKGGSTPSQPRACTSPPGHVSNRPSAGRRDPVSSSPVHLPRRGKCWRRDVKQLVPLTRLLLNSRAPDLTEGGEDPVALADLGPG
jgi:hypothetical protein